MICFLPEGADKDDVNVGVFFVHPCMLDVFEISEKLSWNVYLPRFRTHVFDNDAKCPPTYVPWFITPKDLTLYPINQSELLDLELHYNA